MNFPNLKEKISKEIKKDPLFSFLIALIVILAVFYRTYNYTQRIYVQADNSRDVQIAVIAKDNLTLPLIGQFSSAGPFFYGPWYYWFLTFVAFIPLGTLTHWYMSTFISLLFIALMYYLGNKVGGRTLGTLCAFFAAISPAQINNSFGTWNPSIVPILTLLQLFIILKLSETKKHIFALALGFLTGLALSVHFQSILTLPVVFVGLAAGKRNFKDFIKKAAILSFGFTAALSPLIIFDAFHNWYNSTSLFVFLAVDQFTIWIPNRWLIYLLEYWPQTWATIIGGHVYISFALFAAIGAFALLNLKNFKKNKYFFLIAVTFGLELILYRYYRGQRFEYYGFFAHVPAILLSAWAIQKVVKLNRIVGIILLIIVASSTINLAQKDLKPRSISYQRVISLKQDIYKNFPNQSFDIYGCLFNSELISHPLALSMYFDKRNDPSGQKIGVCVDSADAPPWTPLTDKDLKGSKTFWFNRTTQNVYTETVLWWKEKPPQKGDFMKFLKERLDPKCYPHC